MEISTTTSPLGLRYSLFIYRKRSECSINHALQDSLYLEMAKRGWASDIIRLHPMNKSVLAAMTGYYDAYCRKGLADFLPKSSSPYEKALAVCADDMVVEWVFSRRISWHRLLEDTAPTVIRDMELEIYDLVQRRKFMTATEARQDGFDTKVRTVVSSHMAVIDAAHFRQRHNSEINRGLTITAGVEWTLRHLISPWYEVNAYMDLQSLNFQRHHVYLSTSLTGSKEYNPEKVVPILRMWMYLSISIIFTVLDKCRATILAGLPMDEEEWYCASRFRQYLESGHESTLPVITCGLDRKLERLPSKYRKEEIFDCNDNCGCMFESIYHGKEKKDADRWASRAWDNPQAAYERNRIAVAFAQYDRDKSRLTTSGNGPIRSAMILGALDPNEGVAPATKFGRNELAIEARQILDAQRNNTQRNTLQTQQTSPLPPDTTSIQYQTLLRKCERLVDEQTRAEGGNRMSPRERRIAIEAAAAGVAVAFPAQYPRVQNALQSPPDNTPVQVEARRQREGANNLSDHGSTNQIGYSPPPLSPSISLLPGTRQASAPASAVAVPRTTPSRYTQAPAPAQDTYWEDVLRDTRRIIANEPPITDASQIPAALRPTAPMTAADLDRFRRDMALTRALHDNLFSDDDLYAAPPPQPVARRQSRLSKFFEKRK